MDEVLELITTQYRAREERPRQRSMNQVQTYPFRTCDIPLPQCRTGFVYFLMSVKNRSYTYIGQTVCIRDRMKAHNSGSGSLSTESIHLRPFALMAYICGFEGHNKVQREYIERRWKECRDEVIRNGVLDPRQWAKCAQDVLNEIHDQQQDGFDVSGLHVVYLFRNNE